MNTIYVDPRRRIGQIHPHLFGGFAEHLGQCIYGGIYDPDSPLANAKGLRSDLRAALMELRMPIMRYPGGNFVSGYRWRDGIGPRADRPTRYDLAWHSLESNQFGTNEFVDFCREIGTEPYLVVNCGDGDMREAHDWVEYCNGQAGTALANERIAHGWERPHDVKYWGIGNEVDGEWQIGAKTPQEYARAFKEFGKVMKWADPSIKLLASATCHWGSDFVERAQLLVEEAPTLLDYMSIHWYVGNRDDDFAKYMATSELLEDRLSSYAGMMQALCLAHKLKRIPLAVDEWNVWYRAYGDEQLRETYNLEDALVVAMQLNAFLRHADTVKMANIAQIVNVIAPILTSPEGLVRQPTYHPFRLYSQLCRGQALDLNWEGETFDGGDYPGVRVLDVAGSLQDSELALFIVNRSLHGSTVDLCLQGAELPEVQVQTVSGPDIKSFNTLADPEVVTVHASARQPLQTLELPPHSVSVVTGRLV